MTTGDSQDGRENSGKIPRCEDIRAVLFDYMTRELGPSRSELVREHLRRCPLCQREATEIGETLDLLHAASQSPLGIRERLSSERHKRLVRAYMHPVLDWIYTHHVLISAIAAALLLALASALLLKMRAWAIDRPEPGTPVLINGGPRQGAPHERR